MIKQGLKIEIVPLTGTDTIYSAVIYSTGWEDNQVELQRHVMNVPLPTLDALKGTLSFSAWIDLALHEMAAKVADRLTRENVASVSAAYARGEEETDNAAHRM
jgi:hypothetical protein